MNEVNHQQRTHSLYGASGAYRWTNCLGCIRLIKQAPPQPDSEASKVGTAAHELAELLFKNRPNFYFYVGKPMSNGIVVTKEMGEHVQGFVDTVRNTLNSLPGAVLYIEKHFSLSHLHPEFRGTADAVVAQPFGELHVFDLKYGFNPVDAEDNEQGQYYALGAMADDDFAKVFIHIYQPRDFGSKSPLKSWETNPQALVEFGKFLKAKALETTKPAAPLQSGDWCQYCPAAGFCPALLSKANSLAKMKFDDVGEISPPKPETLSFEQISAVLRHRKLIETWFGAVEEYAHAKLMSGETIGGLKLVRKRSKREWTDEKVAEDALSRALGERAFTRKLLTVSQAEKLVPKATIQDLVCTIEGELTVAPESDRRKEVTQLTTTNSPKLDISVFDF